MSAETRSLIQTWAQTGLIALVFIGGIIHIEGRVTALEQWAKDSESERQDMIATVHQLQQDISQLIIDQRSQNADEIRALLKEYGGK